MLPPISTDAFKLVLEEAAEFAAEVDHLAAMPHKKSHKKIMRISLVTFYDNPILLYACLWYATSKRVTVTFLPEKLNCRTLKIV